MQKAHNTALEFTSLSSYSPAKQYDSFQIILDLTKVATYHMSSKISRNKISGLSGDFRRSKTRLFVILIQCVKNTWVFHASLYDKIKTSCFD